MQHLGDNGSATSETVVLFEQTHQTLKNYIDDEIKIQREYTNIVKDNTEDLYNRTEYIEKDKNEKFATIVNSINNLSQSINGNIEEIKESIKMFSATFKTFSEEMSLKYTDLKKEVLINTECIEMLRTNVRCLESSFIDVKGEADSFISSHLKDNDFYFNTVDQRILVLEKEVADLKVTKQDIKKGFFKRIFSK